MSEFVKGSFFVLMICVAGALVAPVIGIFSTSAQFAFECVFYGCGVIFWILTLTSAVAYLIQTIF